MEEIVRQLHEQANIAENCNLGLLLSKAADAIEELQAENRRSQECLCKRGWDKASERKLHNLEHQLFCKTKECAKYQSKLAGAMKGIKYYGGCESCKHNDDATSCGCIGICSACTLPCECKKCVDFSKWEWRGVQEEKDNEA